VVDPLDHPAYGTTRFTRTGTSGVAATNGDGANGHSMNGHSLNGHSLNGHSPNDRAVVASESDAVAEVARLEAFARDRLRALTAGVFRDALFPVLGLDSRWTAPRWFGSWELGAGAAVAECGLAHGHPPDDRDGPLVRVTSRATTDDDFEPVLDALIDEQVEMFFSERGIALDDAFVVDLRADVGGDDPARPWQFADITIDGMGVPFRILGDAGLWIAHGVYDDVVVGIEARGWPVAETALRTVRDFADYEAGSRSTMYLRARPA